MKSKAILTFVLLLLIGSLSYVEAKNPKPVAGTSTQDTVNKKPDTLSIDTPVVAEIETEPDVATLQATHDKEEADRVSELIREIGEPTPTQECLDKMQQARSEYEKLSSEQKGLVVNADEISQARYDQLEQHLQLQKMNEQLEKEKAEAEKKAKEEERLRKEAEQKAKEAASRADEAEDAKERAENIAEQANSKAANLEQEKNQAVQLATDAQEQAKVAEQSKSQAVQAAQQEKKRSAAAEEDKKKAEEKSQRILRDALIGLAVFVVSFIIGMLIRRKKKKNKKAERTQQPIQLVVTPPVIEETKQEPVATPEMKTPTAEWVIVGASVKGNGHIQSNMPCQDNHQFETIGDGWGIAIVSDGAGSAAHSDLGSKIVATRGIVHFKNLIEKEEWKKNQKLPTDIEWLQKSYSVLKDIKNDIVSVAQKNNIDAKELSATCLVVIYSPLGLLVVHVGDGRMGYKSIQDEWKAMMTPHKGDEANQTIFLVSDFWNIPNFVMSGVMVPESIVVREPVKAFALMSDGCEHTAWQCTAQNTETGRYYDRNIPFAGFFDPLEETLLTFNQENVPVEERQAKWAKFIEAGTNGFVKEQDDKTMIYAVNVSLAK